MPGPPQTPRHPAISPISQRSRTLGNVRSTGHPPLPATTGPTPPPYVSVPATHHPEPTPLVPHHPPATTPWPQPTTPDTCAPAAPHADPTVPPAATGVPVPAPAPAPTQCPTASGTHLAHTLPTNPGPRASHPSVPAHTPGSHAQHPSVPEHSLPSVLRGPTPPSRPVPAAPAPHVPVLPCHVWAACAQASLATRQLPAQPPATAVTTRRLHGPPPLHRPLTFSVTTTTPPPAAGHHHLAGTLMQSTYILGSRPGPEGTCTAAPACHHCHTPLTWHLPRYYTHCPHCTLVNVVRARQCPYPPTPPLPPPTAAASLPLLLASRATLAAATGRPLLVEDFLWSALRQHPDDPNWLVLSRRGTAIALVPHHWAAATRATCLLAWQRAAPSARLNEVDVTAHLLAHLLSTTDVSPAPPTPFPGDHHAFAPFNFLYEPGDIRPVQCPPLPGPLHPSHPAASPYQPVAVLGMTLSADAYAELLDGLDHPHTGFIVNSLRVGFSTTATPPPVTRHGTWDAPDLSDHMAARVIAHEQSLNSTAVANDWLAAGVPLRFCPLYAVLKSSGTAKRLVQDLATGDQPLNSYTNPNVLPPVRLAKVSRVCDNVLQHQQADPDAPVHLLRVDLADAYRHCPLALNNRWQIAHRLHDGTILANNALGLGLDTACTSMSALSCAVEDVNSMRHHLATPVYVDDTILAAHAHVLPAIRDHVIAQYERLGWRVHRGKLEEDGPPSTSKVILGLQVDTAARTVAIPPPKLASILNDLKQWRAGDGRRLTHRRARQLAGTLSWCATTLPLARPFLTPLFEYGYTPVVPRPGVHSDHHPRGPPSDVLAAIDFWLAVLPHYNGTSSFSPVPEDNTVHVHTDASGQGWGLICGATGEYSHGRWSHLERRVYTTTHWESLAAVGAAITFGPRVPGGAVTIHTDSTSTLYTFSRHRCHDTRLRDLLRAACLLQIHGRFRMQLVYQEGRTNVHADWLSRHKTFPHHLWPSSAPTPQRLPATWRPRPSSTATPSSQRLQNSPSSPSQDPAKATLQHCVTGLGTVHLWAVPPSTRLPLTLSRTQ